jgi:origin recognition complex subunit 5
MAGLASEEAELGQLVQRWPHREVQIRTLLALLGRPLDTPSRVLVCGPSGTGKTGVVRDVVAHCGAQWAYASCLSCHTPRMLFEHLLQQLEDPGCAPLRRGSRAPRRGRGGRGVLVDSSPPQQQAPPCASLHDFVDRVAAVAAASQSGALYLVVDDAHRLAEKRWGQHGGGGGGGALSSSSGHAGGRLLSALTRLHELTRCANVGLVLLSTSPPAAFQDGTTGAATSGCLVLTFPAYDTAASLTDVLCAEAPPAGAPGSEGDATPALWREFVGKVLQVYGGTCRGIYELRALLAPMWVHYTQPIAGMRAAGQAVHSGILNTRLLHPGARLHGQQAAPKAMHLSLAVPLSGGAIALADQGSTWPIQAGGVNDGAGGATVNRLEFDLPSKSKFLLLAAYVAGNTPAAGDTAAFRDAFGGVAPVLSRRSKRARDGAGGDAHEAVVAGGPMVGGAAAAAGGGASSRSRARSGPCSFALERVLAIFQAMVTQHAGDDGEDEEDDEAEEEADGMNGRRERADRHEEEEQLGGGGGRADAPALRMPRTTLGGDGDDAWMDASDEEGAAAGPSTGEAAQQLRARRRRRAARRRGGAVFTGALLSDVFQQITSLCEFGLLARVSVDPLEAPRYRCAVTESLALQLAQNAQVPLNRYLVQRS